MNFTINTMTPAELQLALDWAKGEGWNPGAYDVDCFYAADPNGFFIGKLDGEPVGSISGVKYEGGFGFLGLYIVRPEFRGKGFGIKLWEHAMGYLSGCNIGLDGVVAQQDNYKKSGFTLAHRNIRFELKKIPNDIPYPKANVTDLKEVSFTALSKYDKRHFIFGRESFLRKWISAPNAKVRVWMEEGKIAGVGVIRSCGIGYKIGPLFADSPKIAEHIFLALVRTTTGGHIYLDVPEKNLEALSLASAYKMEKVFETARMYTLTAPELPARNIFGITTFELG